MRDFMCECQKKHISEFYHSKIEKKIHFSQKVYRLSNPRPCDSEFRILISVQKMCPLVGRGIRDEKKQCAEKTQQVIFV